MPLRTPKHALADFIIHRPEISRITKQISICGEASIPEAKGFSAILNVAAQSSYEPPEGIEYRKIPLKDDGSNDCDEIDRAVDSLHELIDQGHRVLVHCRQGVSRSPLVVAAYLSKYEGHTLNSALEVVQNGRKIADPNPALWASFVMCRAKNTY